MNWEEALKAIEQFLLQLQAQVPTAAGQRHNFTVVDCHLHLNVYNDTDGQWHTFKSVEDDSWTSPTEDLNAIVQMVMDGQ